MAMLAEPRRKQKWALNPRGKQWSEDSNKFGQKMLEKMGWSSGKGLGANEQGTTEHVRVSFKNDAAGIGYKNNDLDKAWTEHQDGFNSFLQQLQKSQDDSVIQVEEVKVDTSENSLELKSKQSRARVHYHKFTRGKDVKRYSSKDLANIFGQKELNVSKKSNDNENIVEENFDSDPLGKQVNRGGVITINGGNMADYFSKKSPIFSVTPRGKKRRESTSESEPEHVGFGFASAFEESSNDIKENKEAEGSCNYAFENPCLRLNSPENVSNSETKSSKRRKLSNESTLNNNTDWKDNVRDGYKNAFVNPALNLEATIDEACNGKEFEVSRTQFGGVTNSALDLQDEVVNKKRVTFNDHVEYSTDSVKKKKKKKEKAMLDRFEVENKRSKKKKKQDNANNSVSTGIINKALDVEEVSEEINDNEINERKSSKSKKRKSSRRSSLETIVETPEEDKEECGNEAKRLKVDESVIDDAIPQENLSSKKEKKKKKKKNKEKVEDEVITIKDDIIEGEEKEVSIEPMAESCKLEDDTMKREDQENVKSKEKKKKRKEKTHGDITEDQIKTNDVEFIEQKAKNAEEETVKVKNSKKKKTKDADKSDINADVNIKSEKGIFNKENKNSESVNISKEEKHKESVEDNKNSESTCTMEPVREECAKQTVNAGGTDTKDVHANLNSTKITHPSSKNIKFNSSSPWSERAKTSKQILRSLFYRNSVAHFPGANVDVIKGYGTDIYSKD